MDEERKDVLLPPVDIEAEKAVLGSMLKNQDARADVSAILKAEDFYLKEHQEIFRTMFDMDQKGTGVDITTVYSALKQRKTADMVGGITYLSRLMDEAIVPSNARYYAETVSDKSKMRQLINEAEAIRDAAYTSELPPQDILDSAEQRILEIAHKSQRNNYVDVNNVLYENIRQLQEREKNGGDDRGIPTGFRDVDKILGGFQKTDLIILAARPGVGKTAWALNAAEYAASVGCPTAPAVAKVRNPNSGASTAAARSSVTHAHAATRFVEPEEGGGTSPLAVWPSPYRHPAKVRFSFTFVGTGRFQASPTTAEVVNTLTASPMSFVIKPIPRESRDASSVTAYVTPVQHANRATSAPAVAVRFVTRARSTKASPTAFVQFLKPQPSRVNAHAGRFVGTP